LDSLDFTQLPPEKRNFGVVFQGYALFPHLTVWDNVAYPLKVRGIDKSSSGSRIRDALELIQLSDLAQRYPKQLSGGQQQRVALARALVFEPNLLLLDEPLSALDRALRKDMQRELKDLHERLGTTFIYVTHDQEEALSMSNRIAILRNGMIEQVGTPEELYENPASIFVANFLGKSNFLRVKMIEHNGNSLCYELNGRRFYLEREGIPELHGEISIALRPERLSLYNSEDAAPTNCFPGEVKKITYFGRHYEVIVETAAIGNLMVTTDLKIAQLRSGDRIWVGWSKNSGVPFQERPTEVDDAYGE
jgi:putative spermidine/putrescine transport system ATP-binding protein